MSPHPDIASSGLDFVEDEILVSSMVDLIRGSKTYG